MSKPKSPKKPAAKSPGGLGASAPAPQLTTGARDLRLVERAIRESWPISDKARAAMVDKIEEVLTTSAPRSRSFQSAVKSVLSLSRINLDAVATTIAADVHESLEGRLIELEERLKPK